MSEHKKISRLVSAVAGLAWSLVVAAAPDEIPYVPVAGAAPVPVTDGAGLRSQEELETFIDGVMADQLSSHGLAGATIAVVKDGELFFVKGYGYSNIEEQTPMDGENSLVRPGSVSKLFTWTALMQLVERGLVDLDTDVNQYLTSFKLPDTFEQPITPRNILTHTAGLEDGALGYLIADSAEDLMPMAEFLEMHMPERVRPPTTDFSRGENAAYSNWATALTGVLIEDITGQSFDDYVDEHIFKPLGMQHSTFREPLPDALAANMSTGYVHENGVLKPRSFEFIHNFGPAGSLTSSASDMARFMIAHLQHGRYGDARILQADTAQLMHSRQFSPSVHVNGAGLGFYESWVNGRRLISHGGDTGQFHSALYLLPEQGVGLFVSYSSGASLPISSRTHLLKAFMDRYYPATLPRVEAPKDFAERAAAYAGSYRYTRMSFTKNEKLFYALSSVKVAPTEDNTLLLTGFLGSAASQWVEIAPDTFRRVDSDDTIAFLRDDEGEVKHLTVPIPFIVAYKLSWFEMVEFHGLLVALVIIAAIGAIVGAIRKRRELPRAASRARWLAAGTGLTNIIALISFAAALSVVIDNPIAGFPGFFNGVLALILVCTALSFLVAVLAIQAWRLNWFTRGGRIRYSLTALSYLALIWSLNHWNLVGYHFG